MCLAGQAVEEGVPFDGEPVRLSVAYSDPVGRVISRGFQSADLAAAVATEAKSGLVRLVRVVATPRVRVGETVVVAFRLQRVQFRPVSAPFPARFSVTNDGSAGVYPNHGYLCVRDRSTGRLLWKAPAQDTSRVLADGKHVWVRSRDSPSWFKLRRLSDGAVMQSIVLPPCPNDPEHHLNWWHPGEQEFLCETGCCVWDLAAGTLTRTAIGEDFPGGCAMSPTGDRIVYQDGATYEIYELTRRDGFQTARLLQVPLRPVNEVWLYVSAAGEVVWENDGTLFAWAEGDAQPTQSGGAGGTRLTLIPRSSSYHMHVCEMPSNRFVPMK